MSEPSIEKEAQELISVFAGNIPYGERLQKAIAIITKARERDEMWKQIQVPGSWTCDKCGFGLTKSILHAGNGAMSADESLVNEICPNDGTLMRP